ncbi:thioredoxin domain-containing protein [Candidatus Aminicenantes bacterium AC-334-K16]|nr:thioredoxin domain-containing protein [Candidatus Aminicenantes bacterium AC-334-K16]
MEKKLVSCLFCGATNNYPLGTTKKVVCGRCKNSLPRPGSVIEVSTDQLATLLSRGKLPVLVDFYSPTCAPCEMMQPIVADLAQRRAGELMVVRVNVDSYPHLAGQFQIQGVPTFIVFKGGHELGRTVGAMSETDFSLWVASRA